jgi:ATP-binding cassette subfamily B protein
LRETLTAENKIGFDLTEEGLHCNGELRFEDGVLIAEIDGREVFRRGVDDTAELKQFTDIGCGFLELTLKKSAGENGGTEALPDDENIRVCRFTMAQVNEAAELCKVVNYYIETGAVGQIMRKERTRCEKCGRPLMSDIDVCMFCVDKKYVFRRSLSLMKGFWKQVAVSGLILTVSNALYALMPILSRLMTDNYLSPGETAAPFFSDPATGVLVLTGLMILTRAFGETLFIISSRISNVVGSKFTDYLRNMLYEKMQKLSLSSMSKKTSGDMLKRITRDTTQIKDFLSDQGRFALEQTIMLLVVTGVLLATNPLLTLLVLCPVPLVIVIISQFWKYIRVRYEKQWRCDSRSNSILHDIIKGIRVVKTFGNEEREIKKFGDSCKSLAEISCSNERLWSRTFPIINFIVGIGEFFVLYFGSRLVLKRELTLGELIQFTLYLSYIYQPLRWMASLPRWLANAMTSMVKIFEILDEKLDICDAKNPVLPEVKGGIAFKNVKFGYKSYEPVLKNVSIDIKPGEMIGLVGPSGAGKSTIINLMMRLYDPNSGAIYLDGTDLRDMAQKDLHDNMGVVFQETFLFAGSVYDNIAYARADATREEVIAAAKAANAHDFIVNLPDGYNTVLGENGHTLSGGERQRIAIARAVLKNPKILILDEATSSLDPETESKIQEALGRLVKNRTTIAIAHRLSTLRHADRLVVIDKGCIAEVGTHTELLEKKGIYYRLVLAQRQTAKLKK